MCIKALHKNDQVWRMKNLMPNITLFSFEDPPSDI